MKKNYLEPPLKTNLTGSYLKRYIFEKAQVALLKIDNLSGLHRQSNGVKNSFGVKLNSYYQTNKINGFKIISSLKRKKMNYERKKKSLETTEYLELLKKCLTRYGFEDKYTQLIGLRFLPLIPLQKLLQLFGIHLVNLRSSNLSLREEGHDWPNTAETMIGLKRLENIQFCISNILKENIIGDFIETGVWAGGATIFMRAILKEFNVKDRIVWVADSFQGMPKPDATNYPLDRADPHWRIKYFDISLEDVQANFAKYGLLDDQVKFLAGWFKDTLSKAPIKKLSLLRLDADMYQSTMEALVSLYPKLSIGGYVIIDDYYSIYQAKKAVDDFRTKMKIKDKIVKIDWTGAFWQRL